MNTTMSKIPKQDSYGRSAVPSAPHESNRNYRKLVDQGQQGKVSMEQRQRSFERNTPRTATPVGGQRMGTAPQRPATPVGGQRMGTAPQRPATPLKPMNSQRMASVDTMRKQSPVNDLISKERAFRK